MTDVPMLRLDNTETDLMLVGDGQDVFVVLKRRENMKCVIRFVENENVSFAGRGWGVGTLMCGLMVTMAYIGIYTMSTKPPTVQNRRLL